VIAILQFRPSGTAEEFLDSAQAALRALAVRPGFLRGSVGRATDDENAWMLLTEWESVGAYRRGLGGYDVKLIATPLMAQALDQPTAFEPLVSIDNEGAETSQASDRAVDADWVARTDAAVRTVDG